MLSAETTHTAYNFFSQLEHFKKNKLSTGKLPEEKLFSGLWNLVDSTVLVVPIIKLLSV
jgi:hypothetical protein